MIRTASIQADQRTTTDAYATPTRTVVASPPSSLDVYGGGFGNFAEGFAGAAGTHTNLMLVNISGSPILRPYDPEL